MIQRRYTGTSATNPSPFEYIISLSFSPTNLCSPPNARFLRLFVLYGGIKSTARRKLCFISGAGRLHGAHNFRTALNKWRVQLVRQTTIKFILCITFFFGLFLCLLRADLLGQIKMWKMCEAFKKRFPTHDFIVFRM